MSARPACAKLNLALAVGLSRADGRHEVTTVLQRLDLADAVAVEPAPALTVGGFAADTLVTAALVALAAEAGVEPRFAARIEKRIPVAAGLGGGSSDAATALALANELLPEPLAPDRLRAVAASLGSDVPFFLEPGPQLGEGDGRDLSALDLPQDYGVVLVLPHGASKSSTADVYAAFDARAGGAGYEARRGALLRTLGSVRRPRDLAALPPNDLASSPLAVELQELGAFRADVTGAGPVVYGLFDGSEAAAAAARRLERRGRVWTAAPAWYVCGVEWLGPGTIEHGTTRYGRWLRARRNQIAIWIAVVEGLLVALHQISWWLAIAIAVAAMLLYFYVGRSSKHDVVKQSTWIAAVSQGLVVLVPMLIVVVGTFVLIIVAILAVGALALLFLERN